MFFQQFRLQGMGCASYLIGSDQTGEAAVVDPGWNIEQYLNEAEARKLRITHIFETHLHADHASGNRRLAGATGANIYLHKEAAATFPHRVVKEGEEIRLGEVSLRVLHTPGHTWEGITLLVQDTASGTPPRLLSGDTLFIGDVGRPDFAGEEGAGALFESLQRKILPLADETEVYPAHLAGSLCGRNLSDANVSTLLMEKASNAALQIPDRNDFVHFLTADLPPEPPDFRRIVELNRSGPPVAQSTLKALSWNEAREKIEQGAQLVDIRHPSRFWKGHLPGALNVPIELSQFGPYFLAFVAPSTSIILLGKNEQDVLKAQGGLGVVGRYNVEGYVPLEKVVSLPEWRKYQTVQPEEAFDGSDSVILDVRQPGEWDSDSIPGSVFIPLRELPQRLEELEGLRDSRFLVMCAGGMRSSLAASFLQLRGWQNALNLNGGIEAVRKAQQPVH